eukprot:scaffold4502_cov119-Isochrysis_galbana.AAC.12
MWSISTCVAHGRVHGSEWLSAVCGGNAVGSGRVLTGDPAPAPAPADVSSPQLYSISASKKKTPRARGGAQWRLASSGWSPSRRTRPRTRVPSASAWTAPKRAQHRYKNPARATARCSPWLAQSTAALC